MPQSDFMRCYETLVEALRDAQLEREYMPLTLGANGMNPYWNTYEMLVMYKSVNCARELLDKPMVSWQDICRMEATAAGHVDYTSKFALHCAELVMGDVECL